MNKIFEAHLKLVEEFNKLKYRILIFTEKPNHLKVIKGNNLCLQILLKKINKTL